VLNSLAKLEFSNIRTGLGKTCTAINTLRRHLDCNQTRHTLQEKHVCLNALYNLDIVTAVADSIIDPTAGPGGADDFSCPRAATQNLVSVLGNNNSSNGWENVSSEICFQVLLFSRVKNL
jgi:hypothetical protein